MRSIFLALAAVVMFGVSATPALALSCAQPKVNEDIIDHSSAIFEGVVIAEKKTDADVVPGSKSSLDNGVVYTFEVTRGYKGAEAGNKLEVTRNIYWGDGFTMGQAYLVFAVRQGHNGYLVSDLCGPTTGLAYADEYRKVLDIHFGPEHRGPPGFAQ